MVGNCTPLDCIHGSDDEQLNQRIEYLRSQLHEMVGSKGFRDEKVLALSEELDLLILESYRRQKPL